MCLFALLRAIPATGNHTNPYENKYQIAFPQFLEKWKSNPSVCAFPVSRYSRIPKTRAREESISTFPEIAEMRFGICFHRGWCDFRSPGRHAKVQKATLFRPKKCCFFAYRTPPESFRGRMIHFRVLKSVTFCTFACRPGDRKSHEPL